ncbi:C39 family peptidase [Ideonella margarita]|uniref:C39 family peptidase n=1 Tax=Ideonella margarita TaxID=2984191 RepID=A0ABU9CA96_9BURK
MWMLFLGPLATLIAGSAVVSQNEPVEQPPEQLMLPMQVVAGGSAGEPVRIKPLSEFKYQHIVRQAYDYSCGSAALTTVLRYHLGYDVTEQQAMEGMLAFGERDKIVERRGFSLLDMKRYAASLGSNSAGFKAEISDLRKLDQPAIVPIDFAGFKHFVVFRGIRDEKVFLADPSAGHIVFSVSEFEALWDRNTLFLIYPAKDRPPVASQLALSDRELGVIDPDLVREPARLRPPERNEALERAVQTGLGNLFFRRP